MDRNVGTVLPRLYLYSPNVPVEEAFGKVWSSSGPTMSTSDDWAARISTLRSALRGDVLGPALPYY